MTEPIKPWRERVTNPQVLGDWASYMAMQTEIDELRAALAQQQGEPKCSPALTECPRCKNDFLKCDGIFAQAAPREPMTDADIDDAHDAAVKSYRRYQGAVRGQQMRPEDVFEWHLVREVERHHGIGIKEKS